jgi:hypothetical protein
LCIFGIAQGLPERHQEQGLVLRSSADEIGYLLSAGNKKPVDHSAESRVRENHIAKLRRNVTTRRAKR